MNKETEEILIFCVVGFILLRLVGGGSTSANNLAKLQANENITYANDASGLIASLASDWS